MKLKKPKTLKHYKGKIKLFIHIPTMDGRVECGLLTAVSQWSQYLKMSIHQTMHMIPLDYARNYAIEDFMKDKDCTHFLGIDEDIIPMPGTLEMLLGEDKDAIAPIIFTIKPDRGDLDGNPESMYGTNSVPVPFPIVCERRNGGMRPKVFDGKSLVQVDLIPGGFYLLKRRVVEKLRKPVFKYKYDKRGYLKGGTDRYLSEGLKKAGFKMFIHPAAHCEQTVIMGARSFNRTMNRYCTRRES